MANFFLKHFPNIYLDIKLFFSFLSNKKIIIFFLMLPFTIINSLIIFFLIILKLFYFFLKLLFLLFDNNFIINCNIDKIFIKNLFLLYLYDFFYIFVNYQSFFIFYNFLKKILNYKNNEKITFYHLIIILLNIFFKKFFRIVFIIPYFLFSINNTITILIFNIISTKNFLYFTKKSFFFELYYNLYIKYILNLENKIKNNKIFIKNNKIVFNMKKFNILDNITLNNTNRVVENKLFLKQLENHSMYCMYKNKLPNGKFVFHAGVKTTLSDGSSLNVTETSKEMISVFNNFTKSWESYNNTTCSMGTKNLKKKVYYSLFFSKNFDPKYNENKINEQPYYNKNGIDYERIKNIRNSDSSIENIFSTHLKVDDTIIFESNFEGKVIINENYNTIKKILNLKKNFLPQFYIDMHLNLEEFIIENKNIFNNLSISEKNFVIQSFNKEYHHETDITILENIFKKN